MHRKYSLWIAAALLALLAGGYLLRPITLKIDDETQTVPGIWLKVNQALAAADVQMGPGDQIEPQLNSLLPLNGRIRLTRAVSLVLWENGQATIIQGLERTPATLLPAAGISLYPADLLTWNGQPIAADTPLPTDQTIVLQLRRSRAVIIDQDGKRKKVDTTAFTAAEALWQAGIHPGPGDELSVSASALLDDLARSSNGPVTIAVRSAQPLAIQSGGQTIHTYTTAATVGQALAEAGLALQGLDYSKPAEGQPLPEDGQVQVVRVHEEITLKQELIPFETKNVPDPDTDIDQTSLLKAGQYGVKVTRERARYENEREVQRGFDSDWTASEPVAQTVGIGTRVVTKTLDVSGGKIEYWRAVNVYATSYSPCRLGLGDGRCNTQTASGATLHKGIIAVTRAWYRLIGGMSVYVPGYGYGVIGDVGGGIPGKPWIDLGFSEDDFQGIVGWVTMYFLAPAPENVSWTLP